jgi:hypothetical protein
LGGTSFGVCLSARDTAHRILDRLPPAPSQHQILFVPCTNLYHGTIRNEAEVIDLLRQRGVYIVDQRRGTAERINLFRNAAVVIGPHGEGLADIQFCKPSTLVWEWMPRHHQNVAINRLAQAAEVDYWGALFESDPHTPKQWFVDIETIIRRLSEISQRPAIAVATARAPAPAPSRPAVGKPAPSTSALSMSARSKSNDELMLAFESLGDNCEFGLVQRGYHRFAASQPVVYGVAGARSGTGSISFARAGGSSGELAFAVTLLSG